MPTPDGEWQALLVLDGLEDIDWASLEHAYGDAATIPDGIRELAQGANVVDWRVFPDHHAYTREDVEGLRTWARQLPAGSEVFFAAAWRLERGWRR